MDKAPEEGTLVQILTCSPHAGGSTETIASLIAERTAVSGVPAHIVQLRNHLIRPCTGCGYCAVHQDHCTLDGHGDSAQALLQSIRESDLTLFVIPVYFYGPPALFKGLIDRAQRYWGLLDRQRGRDAPRRPALAILCAARTRGERLFEANLLILRCLLDLLGLELEPPLLLRGIETPADIVANRRVLSSLQDVSDQAIHLIRGTTHV